MRGVPTRVRHQTKFDYRQGRFLGSEFTDRNQNRKQKPKSLFTEMIFVTGGGRPGPEDSRNIKTFAVAAKLKELVQF